MMQGTTPEQDDEQTRTDAVAAILAIVPPILGGQEVAERNLRALPLAHLVRTRVELESEVERIAPLTKAFKGRLQASVERRRQAGMKVASGLEKLRAAQAAIQASREVPTSTDG